MRGSNENKEIKDMRISSKRKGGKRGNYGQVDDGLLLPPLSLLVFDEITLSPFSLFSLFRNSILKFMMLLQRDVVRKANESLSLYSSRSMFELF